MRKVLSLILAFVFVVGVCFSAPFTLTVEATSKSAKIENGSIIEFGSYPQTKVKDSGLIQQLATVEKNWVSYDYLSLDDATNILNFSNYMLYSDFSYNKKKYRAVYFTEYRPQYLGYSNSKENSFQDDNGYNINEIYYFEYEPLKWRVLDASKGLIICENIIDASPILEQKVFLSGDKYYLDEECTIYANNYKNSTIRTWLNDTFYNIAFEENERFFIKNTELDNSAFSSKFSQYDCDKTTDKIFLLSYSEAKSSYFNSISSSTAIGTDYAKSQGLWTSKEDEWLDCGYWWLRNAGYESYTTCAVDYDGTVYYSYDVSYTNRGIRPVCTIQIDSLLGNDIVSTDIKYTDLFFGYPYYLDNDIETRYANLIIEQYTDVLSRYSDSGTLDFLAALRTGNSEGLSIYIKAIGSSLGLTDSYYDECADKAAMELLQTMYSDKTAMMEFSGSIAKGLKNIKSFGDVGTATTEAIAYCMEYLTSDEVEKICETIKKGCEEYYKVVKVNVSDDGKLYYFTIDHADGFSGTNDFFDLLETGVDLMEIITTICFIEDIKMGALQILIDSLDKKSELRDALIKYNDEVLGSFKNYISGCYLADKAINKIAEFLIDKAIWDNLNFGAVSKLLGGFIIDAAFYIVYDKAFDIGSGEDIIVTTMLSTFVTELDIAIVSQKLKFFKAFYASDILDYEVLYNAYISAIKTTLVYSKKIADDNQKDLLDMAYNSVCSSYTYENYINLCKNSVNDTPYDERIINTSDKIFSTQDGLLSIEESSNKLTNSGKCIYLFEGRILGGLVVEKKSYTFKKDCVIDGDLVLGRNANVTKIPEGISVTVNGDVKSNDEYWKHVQLDGRLVVKGDYAVDDGIGTSMELPDSFLEIHGTANLRNDNTWGNKTYWPIAGTIHLYGDTQTIQTGETNTVVFCGNEKQVIKNGVFGSIDDLKVSFANLIVQNTSEEGVVLDTSIKIKGEYRSPIKPINHGKYIIQICKDTTLFPDNYYGNIVITESYTFKKDCVIDGDLVLGHNANVTKIPEGISVTVNGDVKSNDEYWKHVQLDGILVVKGDYAVDDGIGTSMELPDSFLGIHGTANLRNDNTWGNKTYWPISGTIHLYGDTQTIQTGGTNTVVFCGNEKQVIKNGTFATLIHDNTSDEGVEFISAVKVNTLFNHKGRPFTLYNSGKGSTFVDYDGDGLKDNVDPEPTVGNPYTITVKTENAEKGTVCESFDTIGGTVVTVTAEPTFKYDFSSWKNSSGKVLSNNSSYSFVAKGDTTVTAYFTKRKRNITVETENGTLTVPTKAEIESTVTITPKPDDGYMFTENSITVNGEKIEGTTFVMPDENVVLGAEFYANVYYFALKEELTSAKAIDQKLYSAETTAVLKTAISNAENSLVNEITQEESDARIAELQAAIDGLQERYVVSVTTTQTTILTVLQNATSPLSKVTVYANYDNGTKVKITDYEVSGLDVAVLGEQTATLTYEGYSTTVNVRVATQSILDVETLISKIPETVAVSHINQVNTAKSQYDALSDEEKNQVQGVEKLFNAVEIVDAICKDIDTAAEFDAKVLSIADLDGDKMPYIEAAFEEYDSFTDSVKSFITQYELLVHLQETSAFISSEISKIDYVNKFIICEAEMVTDINDLIENYDSAYDQVEIKSSLSNNETDFFGTGSTISFYKEGELQFTYTVVVHGDVNGDSVCDVLDCMLVELTRNKHTTLENAYLQAGDLTGDGTIDVSDFQAVVGVAIGEGTFI